MKALVRYLLRVTSPKTRRAIRDLLPLSVARAVSKRLSPGRTQPEEVLGPVLVASRRADRLGVQLWRGFSKEAIRDLRALRHAPESSRADIEGAAWHLAAWYASHGRWEAALENALILRLVAGRQQQPRNLLVEADALNHLGHREIARQRVERALAARPKDVHFKLLLANSFVSADGTSGMEADEVRLGLVNEIYLRAGLATVRKRDPASPLVLGNLTSAAKAASPPSATGPKVTVLVPMFDASKTLGIALRSLIEQTWTNLEIIVVDDCSRDDSVAVAERFAQEDQRIVVVRQTENRGAYAARNRGLGMATGEFVTVHDADDWSHSQKIQLQVEALASAPEKVATQTDWVRCYDHLYFRGMARVSSQWVIQNISSLMIRRADLVALGGWDEVRVAADNELARRLVHKRNPKDILRVYPTVPLSFALESPHSLTRIGATHVHTVFHGLRRTYHESAKAWLALQEAQMPALPPPGQPRAFPAPESLLPARAKPKLDIMFVMDVNMIGGAFVSTWNYLEAALAMGLRVGVFHWRRYDLDPYQEFNPSVMKAILDGRVYRVSPDEELDADLVLVGYPVILKYHIDRVPRIHCRRLVLMTNQMATRLYSGGDVQYDPRQIAENAEASFGVPPVWIPISDLVRNLMTMDGRYRPIHEETWNPLIDTGWSNTAVAWRGKERARPRVGRHGRDHYTKWPTTAAAISGAYCVDRECDVVFLGGADHALETLGHKPANWQILPFGSAPARTFLTDLDFFVHFPHEDYIEEFGRAVLEAMAAGVPVILPRVFEPTFGAAALYAEPADVWPLIAKIWADERLWTERMQAGRDFARSRGWEAFGGRLQRLGAGRFETAQLEAAQG